MEEYLIRSCSVSYIQCSTPKKASTFDENYEDVLKEEVDKNMNP
jgi:hypothetical protein